MQDVNDTNGRFETEFTTSEIQKQDNAKDTGDSQAQNWSKNDSKDHMQATNVQTESDAQNFDTTDNKNFAFKQKNVGMIKPKETKAAVPTAPILSKPVESCSDAEACDTCMSVLTTLKTMAEGTIPEQNCETMIFQKNCAPVCQATRQAMLYNVDLRPFRESTQDVCSGCFRIGQCHLQACED